MNVLLLVVCMSGAPAQYDRHEDEYEECRWGDRMTYESRRRGIRFSIQFDRERSREYMERPRYEGPRYQPAPRFQQAPPRGQWAYGGGCPDGRCPPMPYSNGSSYSFSNGYSRPAREPLFSPRCYDGRCLPPPGVRESIGR